MTDNNIYAPVNRPTQFVLPIWNNKQDLIDNLPTMHFTGSTTIDGSYGIYNLAKLYDDLTDFIVARIDEVKADIAAVSDVVSDIPAIKEVVDTIPELVNELDEFLNDPFAYVDNKLSSILSILKAVSTKVLNPSALFNEIAEKLENRIKDALTIAIFEIFKEAT